VKAPPQELPADHVPPILAGPCRLVRRHLSKHPSVNFS
jgi:hypothetical protein